MSALAPLVDETVLLTNDAALEGISPLRLVYDPEPHAGVLPALAAGLAAARGDIALAVACDMPFVSRQVFEHLLQVQLEADADVVIPRTQQFLEPMHAVYRRASVAAAISAALARGEMRMNSYFAEVRVREVQAAELQAFDSGGRAFFNVNTPEDLAEGRRLAAQAG